MSEQANIQIVDDDETSADLLSVGLEKNEGYHCFAVATGEDALDRLHRNNIDVILLDLKLPGISGMDVLSDVRLAYTDTPVIVITGVEHVQTAVEATTKLLEIDSEVRAIASSGYSIDPVISDYRNYCFSGVVARTYRISELREVLREVVLGKRG